MLTGAALIAVALIVVALANVAGVKPTATLYCNSDGVLTDAQSIQSHRSYCLQGFSSVENLLRNAPIAFSFRIVDDQGDVVKDFDVVHEKIMHFIVVRKDLAEFQHLHPDFDASTGEFTLSALTFPSNGAYRLFADFTPSAAQMGPDGMKLTVTSFQDVNVGDLSKYSPKLIGSEEKSKTFGKYKITLITQPAQITAGSTESLTFTIQKDGKPVQNLEQYLGALGHAIILREGTLDFIHAHAAGHDMSSMSASMSHMMQEGMKMDTGGPTINFETLFPESGTYKIFLQFQHEGKVVTADFVVSVGKGINEGGSIDMMNMHH